LDAESGAVGVLVGSVSDFISLFKVECVEELTVEENKDRDMVKDMGKRAKEGNG
jgi:hypothetical protein